MKKYYKYSFDKATFYEYTDPSKTSVTLRVCSDVNQEIKSIFLEQIGPAYFRELFTKKKYVMIDKDQFVGNGMKSDRNFSPNGVYFENGKLSLIDLSKVHDKLASISAKGLSKEYMSLLSRMLLEAPVCFKLVKDKQIKINRKPYIKKDNESKRTIDDLRTNPLGVFRLMELKREAQMIREREEK